MKVVLVNSIRCETSSVGQGVALSIPRSSVWLWKNHQKSVNSHQHRFELHRPSNKGTKSMFQVIKAICNQTSIQWTINTHLHTLLLLQNLLCQSWLKKSTTTTDFGLKRLYTGLRTTPSQVDTGFYITWPHSPHPTWFPDHFRKAVLALLLTSGFESQKCPVPCLVKLNWL